MVDNGKSAQVDLAQVVPEGMFVGTSLILGKEGLFLYGMRPPREEAGKLVIELTGIGGGLEREDSSPQSGVQREAHEEIGSRVGLIDSPETLVVRGRDRIEGLRLRGQKRPAAIVFRRYRTPPHRPWHGDNQGEACLIVYLADLLDDPWPTRELPALIWLRPEEIVETAIRDVALSELLGRGARLIERRQGETQFGALLRMTDSQEALALALGDLALAFYQGL